MYPLHDLASSEFERLVHSICLRILGPGTFAFAPGADGGRDAVFRGTAAEFPSPRAPWAGTTIVQAKHTSGINASFSDSAFYREGSNSSVLAKELPSIARLRKSGELDHYILFSNRNLSGLRATQLVKVISERCGIPAGSVFLCGTEWIRQWLSNHPEVARQCRLHPLDGPLVVDTRDIAVVVESLAEPGALGGPMAAPRDRTNLKTKHALNNMTAEFAAKLRSSYLADAGIIERFLQDPANESMRRRYNDAAESFALAVVAHRREFDTFDLVFNKITELLFDREDVLLSNKRLTRAVLYYMYWCCDLGLSTDAATD